MILIYILLFMLSAACGAVFAQNQKLIRRIWSLEALSEDRYSQIANLAVGVAENKRNIEEINDKLESIAEAENQQGEKLEEVLTKKWEDAISTISNFDPFMKEEDK